MNDFDSDTANSIFLLKTVISCYRNLVVEMFGGSPTKLERNKTTDILARFHQRHSGSYTKNWYK